LGGVACVARIYGFVFLRERRILIETTKNNERRLVPINDTLYGVLESLPVHLGSDLIFPEITGLQLTVAFRRACKRAGIKDFRFHDLRHSFASYLTMGGVNLRTVQTLLEHKDLRMTMKCSHLSPEHLKEAAQNLDKSLTLKEANRENLTQQSVP
jgi:integrase